MLIFDSALYICIGVNMIVKAKNLTYIRFLSIRKYFSFTHTFSTIAGQKLTQKELELLPKIFPKNEVTVLGKLKHLGINFSKVESLTFEEVCSVLKSLNISSHHAAVNDLKIGKLCVCITNSTVFVYAVLY